jgi:sorting nexin-8
MNVPKVKRRRDPLSPKPVLDRRILIQALKERGIHLKELHLETFYQQLHRQHYPDLKDFVAEYHRRELSLTFKKESSSFSNKATIPTKNAISSKKGNVRRLPKAFLDFLADPENDFVTVTSSIDARPTSKDGTTTKMAIQLQDGHFIESVLMRHVSAAGSRATLCVSSQVGCAMGCTFCATGTMGIRGNLCSGEILEQLVHAGRVLAADLISSSEEYNSDDRIISADGSERKKSEQDLAFVRNIVFMGMGEPLNNYDNVITACRAMIDRRRWNLAHGRVTVSTVGVTGNMRRLTKDLPEVNLALSLHAPNQSMREAIVPTAKMYPIQDMVDALDEHMMASIKTKSVDGTFDGSERKSASKKKRAMIEYVMCKLCSRLQSLVPTFSAHMQTRSFFSERRYFLISMCTSTG